MKDSERLVHLVRAKTAAEDAAARARTALADLKSSGVGPTDLVASLVEVRVQAERSAARIQLLIDRVPV